MSQVLLAGAAVAVVLLAVALILMRRRAFKVSRRIEGQNTCITLHARGNLERISLVAGVNGEDMAFERRRVRKGQSIEFIFPTSEKKARITVVLESGATQTAEA